MTVCPECGLEVPDRASECPICGHAFTGNAMCDVAAKLPRPSVDRTIRVPRRRIRVFAAGLRKHLAATARPERAAAAPSPPAPKPAVPRKPAAMARSAPHPFSRAWTWFNGRLARFLRVVVNVMPPGFDPSDRRVSSAVAAAGRRFGGFLGSMAWQGVRLSVLLFLAAAKIAVSATVIVVVAGFCLLIALAGGNTK